MIALAGQVGVVHPENNRQLRLDRMQNLFVSVLSLSMSKSKKIYAMLISRDTESDLGVFCIFDKVDLLLSLFKSERLCISLTINMMGILDLPQW